MESISLEEEFKEQPEMLRIVRGFLSYMHLEGFPTAQSKVDAITEEVSSMVSMVRVYGEAFKGDYEAIEIKKGDESKCYKLFRLLIDEKMREAVLMPGMMLTLLMMWKQLHAGETVNIDALLKANDEFKNAWMELSEILVEKTEGVESAIRLGDEISKYCHEFMMIVMSVKETDHIVSYVRQRARIEATLREITSELIKVEAKKPKPKAKTLKPKKTGLKGPKTAFMKKQVDVFAAYVKDHPITASVKAGQRARACWLAHKKEWDEAAKNHEGYSDPKSLARAYQNRRS